MFNKFAENKVAKSIEKAELPTDPVSGLPVCPVWKTNGLLSTEKYLGLLPHSEITNLCPEIATHASHTQNDLHGLTGCLHRCRQWWDKIKDNGILRSWIEETGFGDIIQSLPAFRLRSSKSAVAALIERWSEVTHTFHLPFGEMTITPSDIVALTGLPWGGRTIHFDIFMVRKPSRPDVAAYIEELLGVPYYSGIRYSKVQDYWCDQTEIPASRKQQFVRSFIIVFLTNVFFPVSSSRVNLGLLTILHDIAEIRAWNWPRAILGQLYYGMDVCARGEKKELKAGYIWIQMWAFSYRVQYPPTISGEPETTHHLSFWMRSWSKTLSHRILTREYIRQLTLETIVRDPWSSFSPELKGMIDEVRVTLDRHRLVLECPMTQEWYLGERVRWWMDCSDANAPVIPPPPSKGLFWPHLMRGALRKLHLEGNGSEVACLPGNYAEFVSTSLLPPCPRLSNLDTPGVLERDDLPDEDAQGVEGEDPVPTRWNVRTKRVPGLSRANTGGSLGKRTKVEDASPGLTTRARTSTGGVQTATDARTIHPFVPIPTPAVILGPEIVVGQHRASFDTSFFVLTSSGVHGLKPLPERHIEIPFVPPETTHITRADAETLASTVLRLRDFLYSQDNTATFLLENAQRENESLRAELAQERASLARECAELAREREISEGLGVELAVSKELRVTRNHERRAKMGKKVASTSAGGELEDVDDEESGSNKDTDGEDKENTEEAKELPVVEKQELEEMLMQPEGETNFEDELMPEESKIDILMNLHDVTN